MHIFPVWIRCAFFDSHSQFLEDCRSLINSQTPPPDDLDTCDVGIRSKARFGLTGTEGTPVHRLANRGGMSTLDQESATGFDLNGCVLHLLHRAQQAADEAFASAFADTGLTPRQL